VRWNRFVSAQVTASLIHRILWELGISPYIRRFKNEAGTTLDPDAPGMVEMSFEMMELTLACLSTNEDVSGETTIMSPFLALRDCLADINYTDKIPLGSLMAGQSIPIRWKVFRGQPIQGVPQSFVYCEEVDE
jgi:hypothetical protein